MYDASSSMLEEMSPVDIGLPPQFTSWRAIQGQGAEFAIYSDRRFSVLSMPTGSGKSLSVMTIAKITGLRSVILTGTKGLQEQYGKDFGRTNPVARVLKRLNVPTKQEDLLIDIRGRNNYPCQNIANMQCDYAPKAGCKLAGTPNCEYGGALKIARNSQIIVTNYSYWMHVNRGTSNGLMRLPGEPGKPNPVELLILDEAHLAPEELASFLAIQITEREIRDLLHVSPPEGELTKDWKQFAREFRHTAKTEAEERTKKALKLNRVPPWEDLKKIKSYEILHDKLDRIATMQNSGWVCEQKEIKNRDKTQPSRKPIRLWEFDPVWPGLFAENALFCGVPKVVLVSATIRPKTMGLLGVPNNEFQFKEWKRIFPPNRCPIYHIPSARIRYSSKESDYEKWIQKIDEIIESRQSRKGIIHTVSYDRQNYIFKHSRFAKYMIGNTSDPNSPTAAQVIQKFKQSAAPAILVSPSFSTGWDFPGYECEWQIIAKVPFPASHSRVMKERKERDPQYLNYLAMQELMQACGRGMRFEQDRCETFIVDDSIGWFMMQSRYLCPNWFTIRKMAGLPPLPPALTPTPAISH